MLTFEVSAAEPLDSANDAEGLNSSFRNSYNLAFVSILLYNYSPFKNDLCISSLSSPSLEANQLASALSDSLTRNSGQNHVIS